MAAVKGIRSSKRTVKAFLVITAICAADAFSVKIHRVRELSKRPTGLLAASDPSSCSDSKYAWARQFASSAALSIVFSPLAALAVSGGGLDYANLDITGQDFSNGNYKGKDFTQVIAKGTNFANSNLQGCRFYKAFLARADFSGSDLRGASLEDTSMDDAILKDAVASGAYFGASILDVSSLENADFTDAQMPPKILTQLCEREDVKGRNPVTGSDTRDSLMCP